MNYRTLGGTGIKVTPYCLGAMMFGKDGNPDRDECIRMIHKSLDFGINFIDTADVYSRGDSEAIVGEAIKARRDSVVICTKFFHQMGEGPNDRGGSRRWITKALDASLKRLQTDYIDVYLLHRPDPDTAIEETLSALSDLVRAGKMRAIGTSTFPPSAIVEAQWVAEDRGLMRFRAEQQPYSILNRNIEREVLPTCERFGMGVTAWSPLAKGMLTGKYRKGHERPDTLRARYFPELMSDERSLDTVEQLIALAQEAGLSLTQMAMAFVVTHPAMTSAIIGPRTIEQLDDLLESAKATLSDEILDRIDQIVPPGTDVAPLGASAYTPPAISQLSLRRRPLGERAVA